MSANAVSYRKTQFERIQAVIAAAKDYAEAREAFAVASKGLARSRRQNPGNPDQYADELDEAADSVGKAQARVADLVAELVADGSLEILSESIACETKRLS
ncbi:hypothetical protein [Leisingera sp. McT4-56]|uniref:hypothetical protein n=1 Tax=Leisingera sp. McT4-56 TaxID=2881255 RepID=UPI001CF80CC9|nr:hypothetical protein [Leisingera sp. McT4-56]MCB4458236.1 hypothetical protein [Leisingera sp. McT4-56]